MATILLLALSLSSFACGSKTVTDESNLAESPDEGDQTAEVDDVTVVDTQAPEEDEPIQGGMGLRGTSDGGGGEGYGSVAGLGDPEIGADQSETDSPEVIAELRDIDVDGPLEIEAIETAVNTRSAALSHCYERELQTDPDLAGAVTFELSIDSSGKVVSTSIKESFLGNHAAESCMSRVLLRLSFPEAADITTADTMILFDLR